MRMLPRTFLEGGDGSGLGAALTGILSDTFSQPPVQ